MSNVSTSAVIESENVDRAFILGDFCALAHPGRPFYTELCDFCVEQHWRCADIEWLGRSLRVVYDAQQKINDAHECRLS